MRRPFLLDTCTALWVVADEMSRTAERALVKTRNAGWPVYVSPITAWEIGVSAKKGRFRSPYSPQRWFEILMAAPDTILAELTADVLLESSFLPGVLNDDPADRIIAATARAYGYTVMTRDSGLLDYAAQGYLSVLEC
jgi:PIN domain nuclease of toxin-antitoxin system